MASGVYEIRNMVNGHRYIGSSGNLKSRKACHFSELKRGVHNSSHLQRAYDLYGKDNFVFTVLYECQPEELIRCEQEELDVLSPEYNVRILAENNRGRVVSEEQRKRQSETLKGKMAGENNPNWGITLSDERKAQQSEIVKEWYRNNPHPMLGKKHTDETRALMHRNRTGKPHPHKGSPHTEEHNRKIGEASIGRENIFNGKKLPEEVKQKMLKTRGDKLKGEGNGFYGKTHTEETKKIIGERSKRMWEERRANIAISNNS